ncbi:MAG: NusA-like transcription termination signal-binding factor [archaeon]
MVIFSMETIGYINLFEKLTYAHVKDCFPEDGKLIFIVEPGEIGKAVGKNGANVKLLTEKFKKQVKVVEFNHDPEKFLKTLLYPIKPEGITTEDDKIIIKTHDIKEKGQIYGRERTNLKRIQEFFSKYFPYKIELE